jgi:2,5-diketo-D-gluconate reductase B
MEFLTVKGAQLPKVGFGTSGLSGRACREMVAFALQAGYRHIDTAQAYGNEADVGAGIRQSGIDRAEVFLTTKIWMADTGYRDAKRTTADSLRQFGTGYVDLLLIHWPNDRIPMGDSLKALAELRAEGKARHIGVSNFTPRHLRQAVETHGAELFCNQVEYHVMLPQDGLLAYMRPRGIALVAYSPLGRGLIASRSSPGNETLARIGKKYGKSASQVALRWLTLQDGVAMIPKAGAREHCRANLEIFDFTLAPEDLAEIATLRVGRRVVDPGWAPDWDAA